MTSTSALEALRTRQVDAGMGAVGVVLLLVALFLPGQPAKTDDAAAELVALLIDKRLAFAVSLYLAGLAVVALLVFLGALGDFLRRHGADPGLVHTASSGGVAGALLILVGMSCSTGVATGAAAMGADEVVRAFVDTGNVLIELAKFGLAVLVGGIVAATGRSRALSPAGRLTGAVSAAVLIGSALPPLLAEHGVWQMGGPGDIAGYGPGAIWLIWLSLSLTRHPTPAAITRAT